MIRRLLPVGAAAVLAAVFAGGALAQSGAPQTQTGPFITGNPVIGQVLDGNAGTWASDSTVTYSYQWQRCAPGGVNCSDVAGATGQSYPLGNGDNNVSLRVAVTATNADGATAATSAATEWITSGVQFFGTEAGMHVTLDARNVALPNRLFIDTVKFQPGTVMSRNPIIARIHVTDVQGDNVGGALVKVSGLPSTWATTRIEAVTGGNGWAWLRIFPTKAMPLGIGHQLALVVRARVPGTSGEAATSVRRVVQIGTH
ncbi:MAG: hypothetical protein ACYDCH_11690 [Gaiellaceae bacterium]